MIVTKVGRWDIGTIYDITNHTLIGSGQGNDVYWIKWDNGGNFPDNKFGISLATQVIREDKLNTLLNG